MNPSAGETKRVAKTEKVPETGMYDAISPLPVRRAIVVVVVFVQTFRCWC